MWPWSAWTLPTTGRSGDTGRLIWVRLRNCRREALVEAFSRSLPAVVAALGEGQRVVEIG
jgi:hypothetical protein